MGNHRPPAPTYPSRLWLGLMAAAVTGIVGGTVAAAHAVAPRVAADVRLSLTPERSPEPVGHGGLGGPLSVPSIGAVTSDPAAYLPPVERTTNPPRSPVPTQRRRTAIASNPTSQAVTEALTATTTPSEPTVVTPTQAATTPATTTATTEAATTTTEATTTSATTTSETATVSETTAVQTTTEEGL